MSFRSAIAIAAMSLFAASAAAQNPPKPDLPPSASGRRVLDIEKLRAVTAPQFPNDVPTCDVLVVGGGLGGVAAAEVIARQGLSVILTEPTSMLGGQLTSQAVALPDENSYIERDPGPGTRSYRELRDHVRAHYASVPGIVPGREKNVGVPWVSRVSGEPRVWEAAIRDRLKPLEGPRGIQRILTRHQLIDISRYSGNGAYQFADFLDLDNNRIIRIGAQYLLDATEFGDALYAAGAPVRVGQESSAQFNEAGAPSEPRPDWIQSLTYSFALRWTPDAAGQTRYMVEKPQEYEYFKSLQEYTLGYDYSDRGRVYYNVFKAVPGSGGPFWTYRRLIAASSFKGNPDYPTDIALINWRGNDFHEENPIGKPVDEQVRILTRARSFAQGFLYWLQNECPRDEGGYGYPEMQIDRQILGSEDGFAIHPYVRESRRLESEFTLTENHLLSNTAQADAPYGEEFFDSVGIGLYAIDIHPAKGEPPMLKKALPYHIPLGAFIPRSGPANVLPAAKNFGATRLALASARMHPTEWMAGEIAAHLAAFCLRQSPRILPSQVRSDPALLASFRKQIEDGGITTRWSSVLP